MGAFGVLTIFNAAWVAPGAIVRAIFYMLAGTEHVLHAERKSSENWAMGSSTLVRLEIAHAGKYK